MKVSRKVISFVLALLLILSMAVMASAAVITETYYYTVTKTSTTSTTSVESEFLTHHVKGELIQFLTRFPQGPTLSISLLSPLITERSF